MNWDAAAARDYHERTKHSPASVRASTHRLDWANRPDPFKEYRGLEPVALPVELEPLLALGAGVVRSRTLPGGEEYHFRTYSSAGALYPVELYVASGPVESLEAGLYHFHPRELRLRRLRAGDVRANLAEATAEPALAEARFVLVQTGILWRSAWKYQARAYRHLYWDAGTMLANLLALADADGLRARVYTGFVDAAVNELLGVDGEREAALSLVALGRSDRTTARGDTSPLELDVAPVSRFERPYPEAYELHSASSLASRDEVERYRAGRPAETARATEIAPSRVQLEAAIRRRVSIRDFSTEPVPASELAAILAAASASVSLDTPPSAELYGVASAVDGVEAGTFAFEPPDRFRVLRTGDFRLQAGFLVLEQPLGALAAATVFLMADLERVLERHGNRGYRGAQLESVIRAGRVYVGAFARGLGATASTFYDDEVSRFLAPDRSPMLAVAIGHRRRG